MRKVFVPAMLILLAPLAVKAQTPAAEVFAGFSYVRLEGGNFPGWNTSITGNINPNLGFVADFSGYYNRESFTDVLGANNTRTSFHNFLFGPRLTDRGGKWFTPYVQVLGGYTRENASVSIVGTPATSTSFSAGINSFGLVAGGGIDIKGDKPISYRLIEVDYYVVNGSGLKQQAVRITTGVVWNLGSRPE